MKLKICVLGGVSNTCHNCYLEAAYSLGRQVAQLGVNIICSGSKGGLIGAFIDGTGGRLDSISAYIVRNSGESDGLHPMVNITNELPSLIGRKEKMLGDADIIVALPGGIGTIDEILHVLASNRMGVTKTPIGILNTDEFFTPLLALVDHMINKGFSKRKHFSEIVIKNEDSSLIEWLQKKMTTPGTFSAPAWTR